jgi:hypothetical protein
VEDLLEATAHFVVVEVGHHSEVKVVQEELLLEKVVVENLEVVEAVGTFALEADPLE